MTKFGMGDIVKIKDDSTISNLKGHSGWVSQIYAYDEQETIYNVCIGAYDYQVKESELEDVLIKHKNKMIEIGQPIEKPKDDPVNHPKHYTSHPSGVECIEITRHMTFNLGSAVKYLWRNGLKDNEPIIKELSKAVWYINDEIQRLTKKEEQNAKEKSD